MGRYKGKFKTTILRYRRLMSLAESVKLVEETVICIPPMLKEPGTFVKLQIKPGAESNQQEKYETIIPFYRGAHNRGDGNDWKMLALTFSSVRDFHKIEH